jgi:hypothetical protein
MPFLDGTYERKGDPNPKFSAGLTHYLHGECQILLCPARYVNGNLYTNSKKGRITL